MKAIPSDLNNLVLYYADLYGVDPDLIRGQIQQESNWNVTAANTVGEGSLGLMQLQLSTAQDMGGSGITVADLYKPAVNINLGVKYLRKLIDRYSDISLALAAYNWGMGNVDNVSRDISRVPASVKTYIANIFSYQQQYKASTVITAVPTQDSSFQAVMGQDIVAASIADYQAGLWQGILGEAIVSQSTPYEEGTGISTTTIAIGAAVVLVGVVLFSGIGR